MAGVFDISTGTQVWPPTPLNDVTGPQSLAFDDVNRHVYVAQLAQGGLQLRGEDEALDAQARKRAGDMCVTKFSRSGEQLGTMYLRGFGHGISIGVEPDGTKARLWVESQASSRTGYGRSVARVRFRDGAVLDSSADAVEHHRPAPEGATRVHPAVDMATRRVLVSFWTGDEHRYSVHRMKDFLDGNYEPLHSVRNSAILEGETFQGCALHGDFIYQLTGNPYSKPGGRNPRSSGGNTFVSAIDLRTGNAAGREHVTVDPTLRFREPEGIAVRTSPEPLLCIGFSVKSPGRRNIALYGFAP
ncbi:phage baseplate protein [Streptomyces purpureus]